MFVNNNERYKILFYECFAQQIKLNSNVLEIFLTNLIYSINSTNSKGLKELKHSINSILCELIHLCPENLIIELSEKLIQSKLFDNFNVCIEILDIFLSISLVIHQIQIT